MQFLLPYVKVNTTTNTPGDLPPASEAGCDYAKVRVNICNDDNVVGTVPGPNGRHTCSKLQMDVAADDFSWWGKKRRTSHALSDIDWSFMQFVTYIWFHLSTFFFKVNKDL
jgi:hypothetical protein